MTVPCFIRSHVLPDLLTWTLPGPSLLSVLAFGGSTSAEPPPHHLPGFFYVHFQTDY
jgi:hypothetical protein